MTTTSPGWYDDGHGSIRWWDGTDWTDHVATPEAGQRAPQHTAVTVPLDPVDQPTAVTVPLQRGGQAAAEPATPYGSGGYAAAYPGLYEGAVSEGSKARQSRLWIVWVVLGVIVLGVVITLAVAIPIVWAGFTSASGSSGAPSIEESSEPSVEDSSEKPPGGTPSTADQQEAVTAVERFNEAWITGDCESYMATTTEELRAQMEVSNCETFTRASRDFSLGIDGYQTTIGDVETLGSSVAVSTVESYTSQYDAEGNRTEESLPYEDRYEYLVVRSAGGWVIDDFYDE